jgi:hypothetical protein
MVAGTAFQSVALRYERSELAHTLPGKKWSECPFEGNL